MASRRFRNRGHDCLGPHDSRRAVTTRWELLREMVSSGALYTAASCADHGPLRIHWHRTTTSKFQDTISRKAAREKDVDPTCGFAASPEVGPGTTIGTPQTGYPRVQAPSQDEGQDVPSRAPTCHWHRVMPPWHGQLGCRHISCGTGFQALAPGSSGAATCLEAPGPESWLKAARVLPRVPWR
jgi:hypothetical protein